MYLLQNDYIFLGHLNTQAGEHLPGMLFWWQGDIASGIDFTDAAATDWWTGRLQNLLQGTVLKMKWTIFYFYVSFSAGNRHRLLQVRRRGGPVHALILHPGHKLLHLAKQGWQ